ncbi:hypothetical protein KVH22_25310 [Streptomyces olivaceus]|uniref:hypothetical protein n=1 Tax=Streptomyces olivaceus TaxID=47716 RepID=UPI001CCB5C5A|nr:hypothetical protein [Streptomyces olivaceus]MBZ6258837.1 hypothetical protein [Streptomyces olivaceus]
MPDLTQPPDIDEALRKLVEQPSYASQVLTVTARLTERRALTPVTARSLHEDLQTAEATILGTLPESVQHIASTRARTHLPYPYAGTAHEYAARLRTAAGALR